MTAPNHRVIVQPEAEADITDAAIWYQQQQPNLGYEFLAEIESSIFRAAENPFRCPCLRRRPEVRRILTKRFPYRIFFIRRQDAAIVVIRVLHSARDDREWKKDVAGD